jgi:hypothetical protein
MTAAVTSTLGEPHWGLKGKCVGQSRPLNDMASAIMSHCRSLKDQSYTGRHLPVLNSGFDFVSVGAPTADHVQDTFGFVLGTALLDQGKLGWLPENFDRKQLAQIAFATKSPQWSTNPVQHARFGLLQTLVDMSVFSGTEFVTNRYQSVETWQAKSGSNPNEVYHGYGYGAENWGGGPQRPVTLTMINQFALNGETILTDALFRQREAEFCKAFNIAQNGERPEYHDLGSFAEALTLGTFLWTLPVREGQSVGDAVSQRVNEGGLKLVSRVNAGTDNVYLRSVRDTPTYENDEKFQADVDENRRLRSEKQKATRFSFAACRTSHVATLTLP